MSTGRQRFNRRAAKAVALLLCLIVPYAAPRAEKPALVQFEGVVVESSTGRPIPGVTVEVIKRPVYERMGFENRPTSTSMTDARGAFYVALYAGSYTVVLSKPGYVSRTIFQNMFLASGDRGLHTYTLDPSATATPTRAGIPAARPAPNVPAATADAPGAIAVASAPGSSIKIESLSGRFYIHTDAIPPEQLLQVIEDVPPGQYRVTVTREGYRPSSARVVVSPRKTAPLSFSLTPSEASARLAAKAGRYYALVIGINSYKHLPRLKTAKADAEAVATALRERYGFETRLLTDEGRAAIIGALEEYRSPHYEGSNLLIYYAGHGYRDKESGRAYWLPADADAGNSAYWISAEDITGSLKVVKARHVLLVSDSCYSGMLGRSRDPDPESVALNARGERERWLESFLASTSRNIMTSGANEPVADGGPGGHSVFAGALLRGLERMSLDIFTSRELYANFIEQGVPGRSNQTPTYEHLGNSGHDFGDFVFVRRK